MELEFLCLKKFRQKKERKRDMQLGKKGHYEHLRAVLKLLSHESSLLK